MLPLFFPPPPPVAAVLATAMTIQAQPQTFTNPIIYADFPDNDISLGPDGTYYFSASSMHYSPGAPILQSRDRINWQVIGHSVPSLYFGDNYNNQSAYNLGTWVSTLRYRQSNRKWYWIGCANLWTTYVYTTSSEEVTGPWTQEAAFQPCFYDCGLLIDDDGDETIVAQLSPDGLSIARPTGEPDGVTLVWKASDPFGPYEYKVLNDNVPSPTEAGWYFMSFAWNYPLGRVPVFAPITWGEDGFPTLVTVDGEWGESYPFPGLVEYPTPSWKGTDTFSGETLSPDWQWNHNPDVEKCALNNPGLRLYTATVTDDLYLARNTLAHQLHGLYGILELDVAGMGDGDDRAGLAALKDSSACYRIAVAHGLTMESSYGPTLSNGSIVATADVPEGQTNIWLRVSMDAAAAGSHEAVLGYSFDGVEFTDLGETYADDG
ncbi:putative xylosidase/glycosyl hydrolase [Aspergillus undulatus]|uniref:putative xylosidase/glycosyl hydrolase n=1 Tax=Aspergillus undulatus TaxID=1810928 RepID=UPI003CCDC182